MPEQYNACTIQCLNNTIHVLYNACTIQFQYSVNKHTPIPHLTLAIHHHTEMNKDFADFLQARNPWFSTLKLCSPTSSNPYREFSS